MTHRHSFFCIVPSYMLENIAKNGTPAQRKYAMQNLTHLVTVREQRTMAMMEKAVSPTATASAPKIRRTIYTAAEQNILPGQRVRGEGDAPTGDAAIDEAYDGAGETYALFKETYGRSSIDGQGMPLNATVHYRKGYDNAFWNGNQMVYGDGDEDLPENQRLFNRFTIAIDIIGHELTHGVTQFSAGLVYQDQAGALNESMSDIFGSLVKQRVRGETAVDADWLIGAGIFTANVNATALRSLKAPGTAYDDPVVGKDPQPAHMDQYVHTENDHGGVHINSGIPNHAFYLMATEIGGFAWEKAGQIWYTALQSKLNAHATFQEAANVTHQIAADMYGAESAERQAVHNGWMGVGIEPAPIVAPSPLPDPPPPPTPDPPSPLDDTPQGCRPSLKSLLLFW